jgi:hypothetical protein
VVALGLVAAGRTGRGSGGGRRASSAPSARAAHGSSAAQAAGEASPARAALRAQESALRSAFDFRHPTPGDKVTGADPYLLRALPGGDDFVGLLRGSAEIVTLDRALGVRARAPAPRAPTGLAQSASGDVFVAGDLASEIVRYRLSPAGAPAAAIVPTGHLDLGPGRRLRDLASGPGDALYAVDYQSNQLITIWGAAGGAPSPAGELVARHEELAVGRGPIRVVRVGALLLVNCLLDHAIQIFQVDATGRPSGPAARIQHDGPIWSFDAAINAGGDLILLTGGVEDHALDRTIGSFGYIDSFLTVYRVATSAAGLRVERLGATNLSEHGLVTPKVVSLAIDASGGGGRAWITGYGSEVLASLVWSSFALAPALALTPLPPGTTSLARRSDGALLFADPLLDAWIVRTPAAVATVPVAAAVGGVPAPSAAARLGEALFFTTLMAPWNRADGAASRFTCETCHFEGGVDGRTHHTGRGDVRATTKSLRGLLANRPYFSRALDPDLATMVNNEFRVAGANSGRDPWFDLRVSDHPWLRDLGIGGDQLTALELRSGLISFLAGFSPLPNPGAAATSFFNDQQRAGAAVFRDRCEGCHEARLVSDDAATRVPFAQWERLILSDGNPLVWGTPAYRKTGVIPYVHDQGARIPSLRRLSAKYPYFTNGSASSVAQVIARVRGVGAGFVHDAPDGEPGEPMEARAAAQLAAFLALL